MNEIESAIRNGAILSIAHIETTFRDILQNEYAVREDLSVYYLRRYLKDLILETIPHARSVPQKDPKKPHLIQSMFLDKEIVEHNVGVTSVKSDMKCIFSAAKIIRESILKFRKDRDVSLQKDFGLYEGDIPAELFLIIKWICTGSKRYISQLHVNW